MLDRASHTYTPGSSRVQVEGSPLYEISRNGQDKTTRIILNSANGVIVEKIASRDGLIQRDTEFSGKRTVVERVIESPHGSQDGRYLEVDRKFWKHQVRKQLVLKSLKES